MYHLPNTPQASSRTIIDFVVGRFVTYTFFYVFFFTFLYFLHGYVLQSQLWNALYVGKTWIYWQEVLTHPGALLEMASHTLPSFFSSLGAFALCLCTISFCTILGIDRCLQKIKAERRSLLWPLLVFSTLPLSALATYDFVYLLVFFFFLTASLALYIYIRHLRSWKLPIGLVLYVVLYFAGGNVLAYLFLLSLGLSEGKHFFSKTNRLALGWYVFVVAILPWIAHRYFFVQPLSDLYFLPPSNYGFSRPTIEPSIYFVWAAMSAYFLTLWATAAFGHRPSRFLHNTYAQGGFLLLSMGLPFLFTLSPAERDDYRCSHHFRQQDWARVKSTALQHFQKCPQAQWRMRIFEQFKLSLWMERQLCDSLFYYDYLPSCQYLFPTPLQLNNELGLSEIYSRVGFSGAAAHNAYKMASHATFLHQAGITQTLLAEVVEGRDPKQHPYFNTLPHAEAWLKTLANDSLSIKRKQLLGKQSQTLIHPFSLDYSVIALFQNSTYNPYAYDYICALALINKDLKQLETWLPQLKKYGYSKIPRHLQEALERIRFQESQIETDSTHLVDYVTDLAIQKQHQDYVDDQQKLQNQTMSFPEFQQKHMHTYWFYYDFYTPQGL